MYDIYSIGISGGKDSTALLLWAVHESGYPHERLRVTFCDTGNESNLTYDYINMLSERVFPITWLKPELQFYELAKKKGRFPSTKARFCTQELKIFPTQAFIKNFINQGLKVCILTGVRASESHERSKLSEHEFDLFYACDIYRPLLSWSIDDVWQTLARYGIPPNPLYGAGASRVGCFPCIMSNKHEVRMIAKQFPERIDFLRQQEIEIESTFFRRGHVPDHCATKTVMTKKGELVKVPTVDDVVEWSMTSYGGKQFELLFGFDEGLSCNSNLGMCE